MPIGGRELTRISHQVSTAAADPGMSTALRSVGCLDVLSTPRVVPYHDSDSESNRPRLKPWLWPAPHSGANHIPEGPLGATAPVALGARASRALHPTTTATCVVRKLNDPRPTATCLQRHDPAAKRRRVANHVSARETRALPGPGRPFTNAQQHHARPAHLPGSHGQRPGFWQLKKRTPKTSKPSKIPFQSAPLHGRTSAHAGARMLVMFHKSLSSRSLGSSRFF